MGKFHFNEVGYEWVDGRLVYFDREVPMDEAQQDKAHGQARGTAVQEQLQKGLNLAQIQVELAELEDVLAAQKAEYKARRLELVSARAKLVKDILTGQRGLF